MCRSRSWRDQGVRVVEAIFNYSDPLIRCELSISDFNYSDLLISAVVIDRSLYLGTSLTHFRRIGHRALGGVQHRA